MQSLSQFFTVLSADATNVCCS